MGRRRAAVFIALHLVFIGHLVHWRLAGRTLSPVEPSEAMYTLERGWVNAGAIFFALALLATLIFGRFVCGWACHLAALQDLCGWMMKKIGVRPKPFRSRLLVWVPLLAGLYMFVWPTFKRVALAPALRAGGFDGALRVIGEPPPFPGFSNHLVTDGFWDTFATWPVAIPFLLICGFATVYFLGAKGFCTYGCPYGGFFAPLEQLAPGRILVDPDKCHQCGHCTAVCTSNVRVHEQVREFGMVADPGCMKCMDCVSVCPNDALRFGFARPAVMKGAPKHAPIRRTYDLTWGEEVALAAFFAVAFVAWRGLYGLIPMLMAIGIAGCSVFVVWKAWRALRDENVRILGAQLTRAGRLRPAGAAFVALAALAVVATAHALTLRVERLRGGMLDARVAVSKADAFAQTPGAIPDAQRDLARRALRHYRRALALDLGGWGLADHPEAATRAAWLHAVLGERSEAVALLRRLDDRLGVADARAVDLATLLALDGREEEAVASLREALRLDPDLPAARDTLARALEQRGDLAGAIEVRRAAVHENDPSPARESRARAALAAALMRAGRLGEAVDELERAAALTPADATVLNDLSVALYLAGRRDEAARWMRAAADADPDDPERWRRLGQMLTQMGWSEEAAAAFAEADRLNATER